MTSRPRLSQAASRLDGAAWAGETGEIGGYRAHIADQLDSAETIVAFNTDMEQSVIGAWVEAIARA